MLKFQLSTFIFQLLNFVVLLIVLRWFLYRPLLRVMRQRQDDIAARLREGDERTQAVERERQALADERQRARGEAEALLARAREDAAQVRTESLEDARRQAARHLEDAQRRGAEQERAARELLEADARHTAVALAIGLLERMPLAGLHDALVTQLLDDDLGKGEHGVLLRRALASPASPITMELARPASAELQARVRRRFAALRGDTGGEPATVFRIEPSLVAGARILIGTVVLELSLGGILAQLEHQTPAAGTPA